MRGGSTKSLASYRRTRCGLRAGANHDLRAPGEADAHARDRTSIAPPLSGYRHRAIRCHVRRPGRHAVRGLAHAFESLRWERAISLIDPANRRSTSLAERLGEHFEREVEVRGHRVALYAIGRDAWCALNAR